MAKSDLHTAKEEKPCQPQTMAQRLGHWFDILAHYAARGMGHPVTFSIALLSVIIWAATGPLLNFSEDWQLVINTGTTICTFLMVFLIQHTQNRDSAAMHLKIDELLRALEGAHNSAISLEDLDEADLLKLQEEYRQIAKSDDCNREETSHANTSATVLPNRSSDPVKSPAESEARIASIAGRGQD